MTSSIPSKLLCSGWHCKHMETYRPTVNNPYRLLVIGEIFLLDNPLDVRSDDGDDMALRGPNIGPVILTDRPLPAFEPSVAWNVTSGKTLQC